MPTAVSRNISIADLNAAGLRLRPVEAVTIARELTLRAYRDELPGIPSSTVLRFTAAGDTVCEGPVAAGQSVERAGRLLESLLPGFDAPPEFRVAGALRLIVARALGTLDLPHYATLEEFADAIAPFAADDMPTLVRGLVRTWRAAVDSGVISAAAVSSPEIVTESLELTISDVRRARRATGLSLANIAERSRIPESLLRELEWGYFFNWPANNYGRTQLVRYARAAGLDVDVVVRAVWPGLEDAVRSRTPQAVVVVEPIVKIEKIEEPIIKIEASTTEDDLDNFAIEEGAPAVVGVDTGLTRLEPERLFAVRQKQERRPLWLAALAIPALLAIGVIPAVWQSFADNAETVTPAAAAVVQAPAPRPSAVTPPAASPLPSTDRVASPRPPSASMAVRPTKASISPERAELPDDDDAFSPSFASVGSAMFYHADAGDRSALMRADTDTTGAVLRVTSIVDDDAKNFHVRPSPDGTRIAFDSDREGERAVYVADADGQNVRRISGEGYAAVPSWSPDGRTLAIVRGEPGRPKVWNLWTVDLQSGETRRLTNYRVGQPWGAAWFPDGRRIAYSHENRLIIRSLDGGDEQIFNTPKKGHLVRTPAVSPDGRKVMFQVRHDGAWLLDVASGGMRKVLTDPTAEEFTWSPDGRKVAYHSRNAGGWGVWLMAAR